MGTRKELFQIDSLDPTRCPKGGEGQILTDKAVPPPSSSAHSPRTFHYAPLDDPSKQIRLCRILPDADDSELMVTIDKFDLLRIAGCFVALSYACGDEASKLSMRVNGIRFGVTQNLHTQLSRLRLLGCTGLLWIDALRINQVDDAEKIAQVSVMDLIYSVAEEVFIGLDEDAKDLRQAAADHALVAAAINDMANGMHFDRLFCSQQKQSGKNALDHVLCRFFSSAWWWRSWVIQEVCLASKPTVLLGSGFLRWETLTEALDSYDRHRRASCCSSLIATLPQQSKQAFHRVRATSMLSGGNANASDYRRHRPTAMSLAYTAPRLHMHADNTSLK
jgi:hypothetical protein